MTEQRLVTYSKDEHFAAVDISRDTGSVCVRNGLGYVMEEFVHLNEPPAFEDVRQRLSRYRDLHACVEASGPYWMPLYDDLEAHGFDIRLVHPYKTRLIAESRNKTDKVDARILSDMMRGGFLVYAYVPPKELREARELVRHRTSLVRMRTQVKNRIRAVLAKNGVRLEAKDVGGRRAREVLEGVTLPVADRISLSSSLHVLDSLSREIQEMDAVIASRADDDVRLLMTIPGVSYYSALLIRSEIGDIGRFASDAKLAGWIGIVPSRHQSGSVDYNGRITKRGSKRMRWVLIQCAQAAIRTSPELKAFRDRIAKRAGPQKARVAVARKLVKIVYGVLTTRRPSDYGTEAKTAAKEAVRRRAAGEYDRLENETNALEVLGEEE